MRRCFLHIGTHKTGTTALQAVLDKHDADLENCGYLYPKTGRNPFAAHHNIAWELLGDERFRREQGTLEQLINEISSTDRDVLISSEAFYICFRQNKLEPLITRIMRSGFEISVIVYFRNQIAFSLSAYL